MDEPYTKVCECDRIYCDKCECDRICCNIEDWKKQALIQMEIFRVELNNKINILNCITEIIMIDNINHVNDSIIKQIEDIIPSLSSDAT
jgi:hypothetical protein